MKTALPWIALASVVVLQIALWVANVGVERPSAGGGPEAVARRGDGDGAGRLDGIEARLASLEAGRDPLGAAGAAPGTVQPLDVGLSVSLDERVTALEQRLAETLEAAAAAAGADDGGLLRDPETLRRLNRAIAAGDLALVHELLALGIDLDARDDDRTTPLAAAAVAGQLELAELLVGAGADLERTSGRRRMTPLLAALDADQGDAALRLIELGADITAVDKNGESALIWASFNGLPDVVERLLAAGADTDFAAHDGNTALADAVRKGRLEVARLLLAHGADPSPANAAGLTPLQLAHDVGDPELVALLLAYGAH